MKKIVQILVFAIGINCLIAQPQKRISQMYMNNKAFEGMNFKEKLNYINNNKRGNNTSKLLKSAKSTKWVWDTIICYDTLVNDTAGKLYVRFTNNYDVYGNAIVYEQDEWQNDVWGKYLKVISSFDMNGNNLTSVGELWENNVWVKEDSVICTYDSNGDLLTELMKLCQSNVWENYFKVNCTYDAKGNMLTGIMEEWGGNAWLNYLYSIYTYDTSMTYQLSALDKGWQSNAWVNSDSTSYVYDTKGNMLTNTYHTWQSKAWAVNNMTSYTYNSNGSMTSDLNQLWQTSYWANNTKDTIIYDSNQNMLTYTSAAWQNNTWVNVVKYNYTNDANGNMLSDISQNWQLNSWVNDSLQTFVYDANGNSIEGKYEKWHGSIWKQALTTYLPVYSQKNAVEAFKGIYRYTAHWTAFYSGINELRIENGELRIYPNPANNLLVVSYQLPENSQVNISLYDLTGRVVANIVNDNEVKGNHNIKINTQQMPNGIYVLKFNANDYTEAKKILVEHQ